MKRSTPHELRCLARATVHVRHKRMDIYTFGLGGSDEPDVVALVNGFRQHAHHAAVIRVHSACFTGDVLGSEKCDCGPQLHASLDVISRSPWGILVYFMKHEGRGIGLVRKIQAYALQDEGYDTVSANYELHEPIDARQYKAGIAALSYLGVTRAWLLTNNPDKVRVLREGGISIEGVQRLTHGFTAFNRDYISTKINVFQHALNESGASDDYDIGLT